MTKRPEKVLLKMEGSRVSLPRNGRSSSDSFRRKDEECMPCHWERVNLFDISDELKKTERSKFVEYKSTGE
jgi:hypothetical protein